MRVLQLAQRPQRRGAEIFALQLSSSLEERGHTTQVAFLYRSSGNALGLRPQDLRLDARQSHLLERLPGFQWGLLRKLQRLVHRFEPDVIQVNGSRSVKYGSLLRRLSPSAPWVLIYRSIGNPSDWLSGALRQALYRRFVVLQMDGIVAVSRPTAEGVVSCYHPKAPIEVIPRGVDLDRLVPARPRGEVRRSIGTPEEVPVMLFVGSLTAEKRLDRLLRVARAVRDEASEAELWILGEGPLMGEARRWAAEMSLDSAVRFLGEQRDVATYMNGADLLLLTSDTEGTPGVVLEAACLGLPVVATRVGGLEDCVLDGSTGVLAPPAEESRLIEAALCLLRDPGRRRAMGRAAKRHVLAHFSLRAVAGRYEDFYRRVARERAARLA